MRPKLGQYKKLLAAALGVAFLIGIGALDSGVDASTALELGVGILALVGVERATNDPAE